MSLKITNKNGYYQINEQYFEQVAMHEALNIKGVFNPSKKNDFAKCKIEGNDKVILNLRIGIEKNMDIVKVCPKLQQAILKQIQATCDVNLERVNVDVVAFIK